MFALAGLGTGQHDGLVATHTYGLVHGGGIAASELDVGLGAHDEESAQAVKRERTLEVHVSPVYDIERARFGHEQVRYADRGAACVSQPPQLILRVYTYLADLSVTEKCHTKSNPFMRNKKK